MPERLKHSQPKTDRGWQTWLANARPPVTREWLSIGGALRVRLEPRGLRVFEARLRRKGDTNARTIELGSFPALSVADARRKIGELRSLMREGRDPALERRRARQGVGTLRTLRDLIKEYLDRREGQLAAKTLKIERDLLEGVLAPRLGNRLLADLEPVDFGKAIGDYAARLRGEGRSNGTNANKLLAVSRRMFKFARGWGLIGALDLTAGLVRPAKEAPGDRVLFDGKVLVGSDPRINETGRLAAALLAEPSALPANRPTRLALLLTLIMGFRALEVCSLEFSAVDLDGDSPSVAVTSSKTPAGLRTLPLPGAAVALLRELKSKAMKGARFVFPADRGARRTKHLHPESLSRAFARSCAVLKIEGASTHDLRRTCLSGINELGHEGVAERIAGHVPASLMGRVYDRARRQEAMRAALEAWAAAVDAAVGRAR
jgi:integrase